jgi:hypothetical protein
MIPKTRCWLATLDTPSGRHSWLVWGPTRRLALLNLRGAGLRSPVLKLGRYTAGDTLPVPTRLVQALDV